MFSTKSGVSVARASRASSTPSHTTPGVKLAPQRAKIVTLATVISTTRQGETLKAGG